MSQAASTWVWIASDILHVVHNEQLAEHGGLSGLRDANALESAIVRAQQLAHHGSPDAADLAAAYGFGIARNHPFSDGNKRTAFVAVELFSTLNGLDLRASDADCVITMLHLAAGEMEELDFAQWIRTHLHSQLSLP